MCGTLSHSLKGLREKSGCSLLSGVARPSGQGPCVLGAVPGSSAGPVLCPRPVGVSVLMTVSVYLKKEFRRNTC